MRQNLGKHCAIFYRICVGISPGFADQVSQVEARVLLTMQEMTSVKLEDHAIRFLK